jgi:hypothetical protein
LPKNEKPNLSSACGDSLVHRANGPIEQAHLGRHPADLGSPVEKVQPFAAGLCDRMVSRFGTNPISTLVAGWQHSSSFPRNSDLDRVPSFTIGCISGIGFASAKRTLRLDEKWIGINPAKFKRIRWELLYAWQLEPVSADPGLRKLTLEFSLDKKRKQWRLWSIALSHPEQTHAFESKLDDFRKAGKAIPALTKLSVPLPKEKSLHITVKWLWIAIIGLCLFSDGGILLCASVPKIQNEQVSHSNSRLTITEKERLRKTVARYFSSEH